MSYVSDTVSMGGCLTSTLPPGNKYSKSVAFIRARSFSIGRIFLLLGRWSPLLEELDLGSLVMFTKSLKAIDVLLVPFRRN